MRFCVCLLIFSLILSNVSGEIPSPSFCLCALRNLLEDYAMFTTTRLPPRYRPSSRSDVGFYVASLSSSSWKPVNNATWMDLSSMINAPSGMYTRISLDGIDSVNNGQSIPSGGILVLASNSANYQTKYNLPQPFGIYKTIFGIGRAAYIWVCKPARAQIIVQKCRF